MKSKKKFNVRNAKKKINSQWRRLSPTEHSDAVLNEMALYRAKNTLYCEILKILNVEINEWKQKIGFNISYSILLLLIRGLLGVVQAQSSKEIFVYNKLTNICQHIEYLLENIGYMFRPAGGDCITRS